MKNGSGRWFRQRFSTEKACREYLLKARWPNGFRCPHCSGQQGWQVAQTRFECRVCGRQTSLTAGTIFHRSRKPLKLWFRAMWCLASQKDGASAWRLQRALKLHSYQTAWTWLHKLRRAMVPAKAEQLSGTIEVTTTWACGMPDYGGLKQAQGLVILAAEVAGEGIGRICMRAIKYHSARRVQAFVQDCIAPGSTIRIFYCPGWAELEQKGYRREASHGEGKTGLRRTPRADWVARKLQRWLMETLRGAVRGGVTQGHLRFYLDEFTFRFNERKATKKQGERFARLVQRAVATNPIPYSAIVTFAFQGPAIRREVSVEL